MSEFNYPIDSMLATAQKIRTNANNALTEHEKYWQLVQNCISPLPGFMQSALRLVLEPHDKRLRQSFQGQLDFSIWLENAANTMNGLDENISQLF
jgi:hypothetical protein